LEISDCVNDHHSVTLFHKAEYEFVLELLGLEMIYINYPSSCWHHTMPQRFDAWITRFQEFLEANRERYYGGHAPRVIMGSSGAVGKRANRSEEHPQFCSCGWCLFWED
jgi:hypothetical protein